MFGIPNLPQYPDIGQNSDVDVSDLQISGQSLSNKNCHNSRIDQAVEGGGGIISLRGILWD